jgi:Tol biopolymer transport system component
VKKLISVIMLSLLLAVTFAVGSCFTGKTGMIAFIGPYEQEEKGRFIYIMNLDGSDLMKLARWIPNHTPYHNIWSADCKLLAYIDYDEDLEKSWLSVVDTDDQNRRKLLEVTDLKVESMALSPDGRTIVLSLDSTRISKVETPMYGTVHVEITEEWDMDLFTVDVKTGELKRLTDTPGVMEKWPVYSPDSKQIAFIGRIDTEREKNIPRDVFVMDANGDNRRKLAHHTEGLGFPYAELCWSPDGKKIVYYSSSSTTGNYTYVMDADGSNKTKLYQSGGPASWTPDGKGLIFTNRTNIYEVMVIDTDGNNLRTLVRSEDTRISNPIWLSR